MEIKFGNRSPGAAVVGWSPPGQVPSSCAATVSPVLRVFPVPRDGQIPSSRRARRAGLQRLGMAGQLRFTTEDLACGRVSLQRSLG